MYTQDLIDKVKKVYPNEKEMHRLADEGNAFLGRYLDDSSQGGVALDDILKATSLEEIQKKARNIKIKRELYGEWCEQDPRRRSAEF
jgi:hypothetical protein